MSQTLSERISSYENSSDIYLLDKLPIYLKINIRSFNRVVKKLNKPFSNTMLEAMSKTLIGTISEIDNSVFGYYFDDEINIIIKNDNIKEGSSWLSNNLQKMSSVSASIATHSFYKAIEELEDKPDITGSVIFSSFAFPLPNMDEVMNCLIHSQNNCTVNAINHLSYDFFSRKYGKSEASSFLEKKNTSDRILLLKEEFNFDVKNDCKPEFLYGITAYKVPYIHSNSSGSIKRNKWIIDKNTSRFIDDKHTVLNILHSGYDVFRIGRDID